MRLRSRAKPKGRILRVETLESRRLLAISPTADEQEFMQLLNRFRDDPRGEYSRLSAHFGGVLKDDMNNAFWNVNRTTLRDELQKLSPAPPVIWNEALVTVAERNNAEMLRQKEQGHYHGSSAVRQELVTSGIPAQDIGRTAQNVYGYGKSVLHVHASHVIDWGLGPGGMQADRPHRASMINPDMNLTGHDIGRKSGNFKQDVDGSRPIIATQNLAHVRNTGYYVTGAIFQDKNKSGWYEAGEGLNRVQFAFRDQSGKLFTTTGFATGGYQIELPPGTYTATASGGGMKYTQHMTGIVVTDENVWQNWIYDPSVIPPDSLEANNSTSQATPLSGSDQTLSNLSIHSNRDIDVFRLTSPASGTATFQIQFSHAKGNLDFQLLSGTGAVLETSAGSGNQESITANLRYGDRYYLKVFGAAGATNDAYSLNVNLPEPQPPVARPDSATFTGIESSVVIDVLANDFDPEVPNASLSARLANDAPSAFAMTSQGAVRYSPPVGYSGVHRARYTVSNDRGLVSQPTSISVFVLDLDRQRPWQNTRASTDVNDDGAITALDVLLVINAFNQAGPSGRLPTTPQSAAGWFGFVDPSGDGYVSALDALLVVNELNSRGEGEFWTPAIEKERSIWDTWDEALLGLSHS
ncbi:MAG: dockerin type I domain-containing protein [bacterium]|nr:dockerin type I domain-containing protein [bacterium]